MSSLSELFGSIRRWLKVTKPSMFWYLQLANWTHKITVEKKTKRSPQFSLPQGRSTSKCRYLPFDKVCNLTWHRFWWINNLSRTYQNKCMMYSSQKFKNIWLKGKPINCGLVKIHTWTNMQKKQYYHWKTTLWETHLWLWHGHKIKH